jgi:transketolase
MPSRRDLANAIRALSMDAVQQANSGHPGAPMGMADIAEVLWNDFLVHNPANPSWANRDRFVLSNGHGSMLVYSLLHLAGYELSIEELKDFRQLHSPTAGHPEFGEAPGIETTTGPLGQGLANGVGMALAEKILAAQFNQPGHSIIDHHTYVFVGDGCLMEGISHEVCSLAGTHKLGKLIVFYDDNGISIDGEVEGWFTDNTPARFEAYGWQVISNIDGHDDVAIKAAVETARQESTRPTLICCKTIIGFGSPAKQGTAGCHGAPLGDKEIAAARQQLGWSSPPFEIPEDIASAWNASETGGYHENVWQQRFDAYRGAFPRLAAQLERRLSGELPDDFRLEADAYIAQCQASGDSLATRKASQNSLDAFGPLLPELLGGSADLAGSNNTIWKGCKDIDADDANGNYLYYGVREFGMAAIMNGIALHGGFINYGATFLVFMEYCRNAVRMAALMQQQSIFVFTHDSIGLGEDGPTHQPVEQLTSLRSTPNMNTWRPCDTVESAVCWKAALERCDGPAALIFTRQSLPHQPRTNKQVEDIERGGYVLVDCDGEPEIIFIGTGSEVQLAVQAAHNLTEKGRRTRVVSMPSTEVFDAQSQSYRDSVLLPNVRRRLAIEALHSDFWRKYVGLDGDIIGMTTFGASAPGPKLMTHFGFTVENTIVRAEALLD